LTDHELVCSQILLQADCACVYTDFNNLETNISETRSELKQKVNRLYDLEHKEELCGFSLNPLSKEDMAALQNVL